MTGMMMGRYGKRSLKTTFQFNRNFYTEEEGADGHRQVGDPGFSCAVLFDWLDEGFR
jgi:hypothetical protein